MSGVSNPAEATLPPIGTISDVALRRLCKTCKSQERSLTLPPELKMCVNPALPVNLVSGTRKFPCVIARGHDELCGWIGSRWEPKGQ